MRFKDYIRDRFGAILITLVSWFILMLFFRAFRVRMYISSAAACVLFIAGITRLLWDYFRRKSFYDSIKNSCEGLDKKYLLHEMIEKPDFTEGIIVYDALCEANKSMCENVAEHRRKSEDFREYIELWVREIKLPVASLLLMSHNDGESGNKYSEQLKRIDDYIENVLYYARSENAEKDYIIKEVSLKRTFGNIAVKNREELLQRNVGISTEGLDRTVMTDAKWLEYILGQLLGNSMKYIAEGREPEIHISAEENGDRTVLHFRDNGIGIPASDLPYIFEKSYTGENGRTRSRSTGMGLYIVKSLCDRLGHTVSADSVQGEYADIMISFGKNEYITMQE
ncbi:MAG: sensor histidine kinase [Ruminococcus sp.]|nr:sensor histidine kinase [Ruminococcus sp.]